MGSAGGRIQNIQQMKDPQALKFKSEKRDEEVLGAWSFEFEAHIGRMFQGGTRTECRDERQTKR